MLSVEGRLPGELLESSHYFDFISDYISARRGIFKASFYSARLHKPFLSRCTFASKLFAVYSKVTQDARVCDVHLSFGKYYNLISVICADFPVYPWVTCANLFRERNILDRATAGNVELEVVHYEQFTVGLKICFALHKIVQESDDLYRVVLSRSRFGLPFAGDIVRSLPHVREHCCGRAHQITFALYRHRLDGPVGFMDFRDELFQLYNKTGFQFNP